MATIRDWAVALEGATGVNPKIKDGWGNPIRVQLDRRRYVITSAGRDGLFQKVIKTGPTMSFDDDIVFADGLFIQFPEGI